MNREEIRTEVLRILGEIAPEADLEHIEPDVEFREQIDLDSMDYLNFVIAIDEQLSAGIPESDYTEFQSLTQCVDYLEKRLAFGVAA